LGPESAIADAVRFLADNWKTFLAPASGGLSFLYPDGGDGGDGRARFEQLQDRDVDRRLGYSGIYDTRQFANPNFAYGFRQMPSVAPTYMPAPGRGVYADPEVIPMGEFDRAGELARRQSALLDQYGAFGGRQNLTPPAYRPPAPQPSRDYLAAAPINTRRDAVAQLADVNPGTRLIQDAINRVNRGTNTFL